jgi:hypothetical protein
VKVCGFIRNIVLSEKRHRRKRKVKILKEKERKTIRGKLIEKGVLGAGAPYLCIFYHFILYTNGKYWKAGATDPNVYMAMEAGKQYVFKPDPNNYEESSMRIGEFRICMGEFREE